MRPARRAARAAILGSVLAALLTSLTPALPTLASGPVKVVGRHVQTSVDHQRLVPLPIDASHVALKWRGAPDAHLLVAFGERPNALGEDVPLDVVDPDEAPDDADVPATARAAAAATDNYSDVIWTGGARFVRVTTDRPIGRLTVIAIDAKKDAGIAPAPANVASAAVDQPAIVSRAGWGADESLRFDAGGHETWPSEYSPMQKAIVHHTAGRNGDPNPAATVRAIYWVKTVDRGFGDIGYNFLIDEQGRIYEGRHSRDYAPGETPTGEDLAGNIIRGGHAVNYNDGTVGIALLGNFQKRQPTTAARNALDRLLAWKLERHGLNPLAQSVYRNPVLGNTKTLYNISGHRNVNATACPGDTFYPTFPQLRQRVAARIAATTGPSHDSDPPTVASLTSLMADPTGSTTLSFGLVFDEPVGGLDAADFDISGSSHGWDVADINGGPEGYTIELAANNPDDGTVQLELAADAVNDRAGHSGPADPVSADATFAEDGDAPTVVLYATPHRQFVRDSSLNYFNVTATFSEPVTGFDAGDVVLGGTSHAARPWKVPAMFGAGANYGFSVVNHSWLNGTLTFQVPDGAVTDLAGNPVAASNLVKVWLDTGRPTTSVPRVALRADTTLGDGSLRVRISWTGTDVGPSGVASYDVARSIDGAAFHTIANGVTGTSITWGVSPGHTYRFEVRAHDKAGNVGYWKASPTLRPWLVQQTSSLVHFFGPSTTIQASGYTGGSARYLAAGGAYAILKTTARAMSFVTTKGPGRGEVKIYIDGVYQTTIDLEASSTTYRYVAFSRWWSSAAVHTIKVVAVGTAGRPRVDVDAFGVFR
jgi:hypothetical protein